MQRFRHLLWCGVYIGFPLAVYCSYRYMLTRENTFEFFMLGVVSLTIAYTCHRLLKGA